MVGGSTASLLAHNRPSPPALFSYFLVSIYHCIGFFFFASFLHIPSLVLSCFLCFFLCSLFCTTATRKANWAVLLLSVSGVQSRQGDVVLFVDPILGLYWDNGKENGNYYLVLFVDPVFVFDPFYVFNRSFISLSRSKKDRNKMCSACSYVAYPKGPSTQ